MRRTEFVTSDGVVFGVRASRKTLAKLRQTGLRELLRG